MNKLRIILILAFFSFSFSSIAQIGGQAVYSFLNLTNSARVAALGGNIISINDNDLNLSFENPSLLNPEMNNNFVLNYVNYFSDINYGYISYANEIKGIGTFAAGLHYINYGEFDRADEIGNINGKFYASEYAVNLMYSKAIDSSFRIGVNIKPIYSVLESYKSFGIVGDAGITYTNSSHLFSGALVVKNFGTQLKPYTKDNFEPVPFEIEAGISQKLEHAPFRISLVAEHLEKYNLNYTKPTDSQSNIFSNETSKANIIKEHADKIMRHLVLGVEIIPTPNFYLNLGYNYRRRQELKIDDRSYTVGFSWGFGLKISKFRLSYGRATYHLAGATNHFSLSTNLSEFYKKAVKINS